MTFAFSRRLFLRLLGVVYLIAFASLGVQMTGLVGSRGILPVGDFLTRAHAALGPDAYRVLPTLLWVSSSDAALLLLCWGGAALSIALVFNVVPVATAALLWVFYLSLTVAGQVFLEFQWDSCSSRRDCLRVSTRRSDRPRRNRIRLCDGCSGGSVSS